MYTLVGVDSNAYGIISYVARAMRREGKDDEKIDEYVDRATSSDYAHLIAISEEILHELNNKQ